MGLRGIIELSWRGAAAALHKVAFSSLKATLAVKKESNCCW